MTSPKSQIYLYIYQVYLDFYCFYLFIYFFLIAFVNRTSNREFDLSGD